MEDMAKQFLIFFYFISSFAFASPNDSEHVYQSVDKKYILSYLSIGKQIVTFPKFVKQPHHLIIVPSLIFGSFMTDGFTNQLALQNQNKTMRFISQNVFDNLGGGYGQLGIISIYGMHYLITKNNASKSIVLTGAQAFLISGLVVQLPKFLVQRERPYKSVNGYPYRFNTIFKTKNNLSFYSGHTTTSFALATVIASEYKSKPWIRIVSYTLASGVGISRIYDNKHWLSDVCVGALTGYGIGKLCHWMNHKVNKKKKMSLNNFNSLNNQSKKMYI